MLSLTRLYYLGSGFVCSLLLWIAFHSAPSVVAGEALATQDPDAACASCHREIVERYRNTAMAHASGSAADGFLPADFQHPTSGVHYRIVEDSSRVWLTYDRDALIRGPQGTLHGRQQLQYFIGSGKRGRTYLFQQQGYWFESPINWYAKKQIWDMAPNYQNAREAPLTMPVDSGCLRCHASAVAAALPDARNHYAAEPFASGGIACAACHGDPAAHVASGGKVHLVNIDSLQPARRDSVCLSCHLEGQISVDRFGRSSEQFKPGDNLFDDAVFLTHRSEEGSGGRATSQYEALLKSACKRVSGDKLTCTSCHDPHSSPAPEERVAFYRQKCLACHQGAAFAAKHHPEDQDCTACHMARPPSNDIAHEQVTDHWIRKRVSQERLPLATTGELVAVGGSQASDRDLGLAFAQIAEHGDEASGARAIDLLRHAERTSPDQARDHELHSHLGFLEQLEGHNEDAAREYRTALTADPYDVLAAEDLALIDARQHNIGESIRLGQSVVEHDPSQSGAAMNLAIIECAEGQKDAALATLDRLLMFAPDHTGARDFAGQIRSGHRVCSSK
ncbi:MAG TPA: cytochrome c3 family protein [Terracidiphilus sp.]|nr:cytochrome c3 family protein [Terracidiphilus sp.]